MKVFVYIPLFIFFSCTQANTQARRIVIEMNHADYSVQLTENEISIIGNSLTQLLKEYIEYSSFQNEEGTFSNENTKAFLDLFDEDARLYSDLHLDYQELYPDEYAQAVESSFGDYGLDATIDYAGLISLGHTTTKGKYIGHLAIQKVVYSKIAITGERIFFKDGQHVKFDLFVTIDLANNSYKISKISNDLAKPVQQVHTTKSKDIFVMAKPHYSYINVPKRKNRQVNHPSSFFRMSVGNVLESSYINEDFTSTNLSSRHYALSIFKPIGDLSRSMWSLGVSMNAFTVSSRVVGNTLSLINNDPISYVSTSRGHLLELNEEPNFSTTSTQEGEVLEQMKYSRFVTSIGLSQKLSIRNLAVYVGAELMPGRVIYKNGVRDATGIKGYKMPDNAYFPSMNIINQIDPSVLNNPSYLVSEEERTTLYDTDRFELNAGVNVMIEYQLHRRFSISSKLSRTFQIAQQKNYLLDNQLTPVFHNTPKPLKINSMLVDLGIILKY